MIDIKKIGIAFTLFGIFGCIEPNVEDLWTMTTETILETNGFARNIDIVDNTAFVAAGQSGVQVWDLVSASQVQNFTGYVEGGAFLEFDDIALIKRDATNNTIFVSESNKDVKIFHYDGEDSLTYRNTIMSAKTKDFISFPTMTDQIVMYSADNDDGMKWHFYNLDTTDIFGIEFIEWTPYGGDEIYTPGKATGIDSNGDNQIAMAVDQMGVELFSMDSLGASPVFEGRVDTDGNAEQVLLHDNGLFVACDDAGADYIPYTDFTTDDSSRTSPVPLDGYNRARFAQDLTVDHISISGDIAALSLGSKGIALYDISNPSAPEEKGIFPIGYTYRSQFWGDKLVVCSREGLQILNIYK